MRLASPARADNAYLPRKKLPLDVNKAIRCWFGGPSRGKAHPSSSKIHDMFPLKTNGKDIISRCIPPFPSLARKQFSLGIVAPSATQEIFSSLVEICTSWLKIDTSPARSANWTMPERASPGALAAAAPTQHVFSGAHQGILPCYHGGVGEPKRRTLRRPSMLSRWLDREKEPRCI